MRLTRNELIKQRKAIGVRIAALRKSHKPSMTQYDLAVAAGCRPETVSRIERGAVDFGVSNLFRIAAALSISAEDLLRDN